MAVNGAVDRSDRQVDPDGRAATCPDVPGEFRGGPLAMSDRLVPAMPGESVVDQPGIELLRGANPVVEDGGVDLHTADLVRIAGKPVPYVLDPEDRAALLDRDALAQALMPGRQVRVRIVQPQGQVDAPRPAIVGQGDGHVVPLVPSGTGRGSETAFVAIVESDHQDGRQSTAATAARPAGRIPRRRAP